MGSIATNPGGIVEPVKNSDTTRFHAMDWLRCGAFLLLIVVHTATLFSAEGWHLRFPTMPGVAAFLAVCKPWRMELIFLVSGTALSYSLDRRGPLAFAWQSCKRLLPPLLVGVVLLIPPVFYFEAISTSEPISMWQAYRDGMNRLLGGDLTWYIFWYLGYLLAFSIGLAIVWRIIRPQVLEIRAVPFPHSGRGFALLLLAGVPFVLIEVLLSPFFPVRRNFVSDIASVMSFGWMFIYGISLMRNPTIISALRHFVKIFVVLTVLVTVAAISYDGRERLVTDALRGAQIWVTVCALVGVAARFLNWRSAKITWFNRIVFPFYLLHQVAVLACAYLLGRMLSGWPLLFVTAILAAILSIVVVKLVIEPVRPVHRLFGFAPKPVRVSGRDAVQ